MDTDLDTENPLTPEPAAEDGIADLASAADPATATGLATPAAPAATTAKAAVLALANEPQMRLTHDDVVYDPLPSDAALGALLFALRPGQVGFGVARHADRLPLRMALDSARQFERVLARYVARADREAASLPGRVTVADLRDWVLQAARSVPAAEQERFCWRLARALGADPWGDGSPAIELSGQQFALFETRFDEAGLPVVAPGAEEQPAPASEPMVPPAPAGEAAAEAVVAGDAALVAEAAQDGAPASAPAPQPAKPKTPRAPRARKKAAAGPAPDPAAEAPVETDAEPPAAGE